MKSSSFIATRSVQKLFGLFNVRPSEAPLVGLMLIYALFMGVPGIITETTGYSLFLQQFSAQAIPYVYIGFAVVTTVLGLIFTRLEPKLSLSALFFGLLVVLAVPLLVFWVLLRFSTASWPIVGLAIWSDTIWVIASLAFWGLATHLFTLRQGKRLFGLLGAGVIVSEVISGLMIPLLVPHIGTENLLLIAVAAVLGALGVQTYIVKTYTQHLSAHEDDPVFFQEKAWWQLVRQPYIALIFGLAALNLIAYFFIDNLFYAQAEQRYTDTDALAALLGTFFAVAGLLTAIIGALISGRFFYRHGLRTGLLVLPVVLFAGITLAVIIGVMPQALALLFWVVLGVKLLNEVLKDSINESAVLILYQPLPATQRLQIQTAVEGIIRPLAAGTAGVLLLLLGAVLAQNATQLEVGLLILLLGWIALAVVMAKKYPHVLMQALTRRKLDGAVLTLEDETSITTLEQTLHNPHPGVALYALNMLTINRPDMAVTVLPELLTHPAVEVKQEALGQIERLNLTTATENVEQCLNKAETVQVKTSAMRTLAALDSTKALELVFPYLDATDPALQQGAIICIIGYGNPEVAIIAEGRLLQLVVSANPADRITAARILGAIPNRNLHQPLIQLIQDENAQVQRAALAAAGQARYPQLWPTVVAAIPVPDTRAAAASALVAGDEMAIPAIANAVNQPHTNLQALIRLARVVGRIDGPRATSLLLQHVDTPHEALRTAILSGLESHQYQAGEQEQALLMQQIDLEVEQASWLIAALNDLQQPSEANDTAPSLQFLNTVLHTQLTRAKDRIFSCLSFLYGDQGLLRVRENLAASSAQHQSYALEILDTMLPLPLKQRVLPLLEPLSYAQRLERLRPTFPQECLDWQPRLILLLNQPSRGIDDLWLSICTVYTAGLLSTSNLDLNPDLIEAIASKLHPDNSDGLMTETAIWTLTRLYAGQQIESQWPHLVETIQSPQPKNNGDKPMLSTLEKVIFLKSVNLFQDTADEILTQLAMLLEEVNIPARDTIFEKGTSGDCMYIIISGQVEVYDGDHLLNGLNDGDVFGEMALLDSRARLASIVAITDTHLLRLDQEPFYELMEDHIEVARGVIFVLSGYLHHLLDDVSQLKSQSPSML